jgi:hypothetical protein
MKICSAILAIAASTVVAQAGLNVVAEFAIHDHPNGGVVPPTYALRLDYVFGFNHATFSAEQYNNTTLTVLEDSSTGDLFIDIVGRLYGGQDTGTGWVDPFDLDVSFRYAANVVATSNGWSIDGFSLLNTGTITRLDTNETMVWYGQEDFAGDNGPIGNAFTLASDGWNIDGDDSTWVGRGWMTTNTDGTPAFDPAQDWIFTATVIPAPATMGMLGLGGLMFARRRRA